MTAGALLTLVACGSKTGLIAPSASEDGLGSSSGTGPGGEPGTTDPPDDPSLPPSIPTENPALPPSKGVACGPGQTVQMTYYAGPQQLGEQRTMACSGSVTFSEDLSKLQPGEMLDYETGTPTKQYMLFNGWSRCDGTSGCALARWDDGQTPPRACVIWALCRNGKASAIGFTFNVD